MVADTPCVAHTGCGNDDLRRLILIYRLGFFLADGSVESGEKDGVLAGADKSCHFFINKARVALQEDARSLDCKRTVDINGEIRMPLYKPLLLYRADKLKHLLRSADCKGRYDDIAAAVKGALHVLRKAGYIIRTAALVLAVAVGRFKEQIVSVCNVLGVTEYGLIEVSDITGKDYFILTVSLVQPYLNSSRAEQMPDIGEANGNGVV